MIKIIKNTKAWTFLGGTVVLVLSAFTYLNRGLSETIFPAEFQCLEVNQGKFERLDFTNSKTMYGIGLTYSNHINETASDFNSEIGPPIFKKSVDSIVGNGKHVSLPTYNQLTDSLERLESGLGKYIIESRMKLNPLLDHEVELGFVFLEDVSDNQLDDPDFAPNVGFFVANDLSARSIAILGEGQTNRFDYWGESKSFNGFTPAGSTVWIPEKPSKEGMPCVNLSTYVNGELRQQENTQNLIYTPVQLMRLIIQKYPDSDFKKGDLVLTGTPGGVILTVPRWKVRMANLIGMDRFQKLQINQKESSAKKYLKAGDLVEVQAEWLGKVSVTIVESRE